MSSSHKTGFWKIIAAFGHTQIAPSQYDWSKPIQSSMVEIMTVSPFLLYEQVRKTQEELCNLIPAF